MAPVALSLKQALVERGWTVESEVGSSGCRVGLAVRHPDHPESFLLGVDIESQAHGQAATARDRNRLRNAVLSALGWRLVHLWALDWCFDHERELARIEAALAKALAEFSPPDERQGSGGNEPEPEEQDDDPPPYARLRVDLVPVDEEELALDTGETVYQTTELAPAEGGNEAFHSRAANGLITRRILRLVENESPIAPEFIARRVAACWGINRLSRKVVDRVFGLVPMNRVCLTQSGNRQFVWWHQQEPDAYTGYRVPDPAGEFQRGAEHICAQEVANAMGADLNRHLSLGEEDLLRAAAGTFGFSRVGTRVKQSMRAGLDHLLASHRATLADGMVSLTEQD